MIYKFKFSITDGEAEYIMDETLVRSKTKEGAEEYAQSWLSNYWGEGETEVIDGVAWQMPGHERCAELMGPIVPTFCVSVFDVDLQRTVFVKQLYIENAMVNE